MKLHFSQEVNGKPTYFVERIIIGLIKHNLITIDLGSELLKMPMSLITNADLKPKITTIRRDLKNRWKANCSINFIINFREEQSIQFAPAVKVISTQKILIKHSKVRTGVWSLDSTIWIDGKILLDMSDDYLKLANNSGFDTVEEFFDYYSKDFIGKIIHWTRLKY